MDPDACLSEIRSIVQLADHPNDLDAVEDRFDRLVDLVDSMDTWMSRGGHSPKPWQPPDPLRCCDAHQEPAPAGDEHEEDGLADL